MSRTAAKALQSCSYLIAGTERDLAESRQDYLCKSPSGYWSLVHGTHFARWNRRRDFMHFVRARFKVDTNVSFSQHTKYLTRLFESTQMHFNRILKIPERFLNCIPTARRSEFSAMRNELVTLPLNDASHHDVSRESPRNCHRRLLLLRPMPQSAYSVCATKQSPTRFSDSCLRTFLNTFYPIMLAQNLANRQVTLRSYYLPHPRPTSRCQRLR